MRKKICFLVDSIFSFGGVQRVTAVIAKGLSCDYDVTVVTLDAPSAKDTSLYGLEESPLQYRFFKYQKINYWKDKFCKCYSFLYRKALPKTAFTSCLYAHSSFPSELRDALADELEVGHYQVIIGVHAPLAVRLAACKKRLGEAKLVGWIHNSYDALYGEESRYIGPELRYHYELQLQKLSRTIVLCECDARKYHIPTSVIYNPLTLVPGLRSTGTSKHFLAIGRFSPLHKGFDLLIEAFHLFAKHNDEWILDIVGEGQEAECYQQMIAKHKLQQRVIMHPFTKNIQEYYSQAQVYVLSSRWEGMPLVLVEAMSHGLPVVASDLPVCQEIMGTFGLYFKNGNIEDLARQMENAARMDWAARSSEAIALSKHYEQKNIIQQWKKLIEE